MFEVHEALEVAGLAFFHADNGVHTMIFIEKCFAPILVFFIVIIPHKTPSSCLSHLGYSTQTG